MEKTMKTASSGIEIQENKISFRNRDYFLGWQCRVREQIMRRENGRPTKGIRPKVLLGDPEKEIAEIILLLFPREPKESTMQFHYMIKRTHDPQIRFSKAVQWLSSSFYQHPEEFGGVLTALFAKDSNLFEKIKIRKECVLVFDYQQQRFKFACVVNEVSRDTPEYQFTFWHNKLFNSLLPTNARVLVFHPDWKNLEASPEVSLAN